MAVSLPGLTRLGTSWPTGTGRRALPDLVHRDDIDGGTFSISGTVYLKGPPQVPASRRVRLHDYYSGRPVREVLSDVATGAYLFEQIKPGLYYVVAFDHTGAYNAVIKDRIQAV